MATARMPLPTRATGSSPTPPPDGGGGKNTSTVGLASGCGVSAGVSVGAGDGADVGRGVGAGLRMRPVAGLRPDGLILASLYAGPGGHR